MIRVLIADDIKILRQGLEAILSLDSDIEIVGLAADGDEAYRLAAELHPDVVLMDMRMPVYDGEYGTRKIKEAFPDIKVLILTTFDDDENISKAMSGGADGYLLKETDNATVIGSVKAAASGVAVFGGSAAAAIQRRFSEKNSDSGIYRRQDGVTLTARELDIIRLITDGCDNKEISARLFLAEGTVRNNISRMLEKLGLKDRTQLAVYAVKNNLV